MRSINLEQPIFVFYLNVTNKSPQKAKEEIKNVVDNYSYDNITTWFIPIQGESRIECIYKPNDKLKKLIDKINSIINDYQIDSPELNSLIRDFKIENILEEE
jgi:hypothetical protein